MNNHNPTCAITGKKENLTMHAFRDDNGNMIGWVFLSSDISDKISEFNISIATEWKNKIKSRPIGFGSNKLDHL